MAVQHCPIVMACIGVNGCLIFVETTLDTEPGGGFEGGSFVGVGPKIQTAVTAVAAVRHSPDSRSARPLVHPVVRPP